MRGIMGVFAVLKGTESGIAVLFIRTAKALIGGTESEYRACNRIYHLRTCCSVRMIPSISVGNSAEGVNAGTSPDRVVVVVMVVVVVVA
jgi:hypothetical protein